MLSDMQSQIINIFSIKKYIRAKFRRTTAQLERFPLNKQCSGPSQRESRRKSLVIR